MRGIFITFEGIEGCGKSTQSEYLSEYFKDSGREVILTREPGGTETGTAIRKLLLESKSLAPVTELLLFLADRSEHIETKILPALERGAIVICDRFYHSTFAYQAGGRKLDSETVRKANLIATRGLEPDLTFLVDIPVEEGFKRKKKGNMDLDRIEKEDLRFHESLREAYLELLKTERMMVRIDGTKDREAIREEIQNIVKMKWASL